MSKARVGDVANVPEQPVTLDEVLVVIGEFGRGQRILYFLFSSVFLFTSMQLFGWVFVGANPAHQCGQGHMETQSIIRINQSSCHFDNGTSCHSFVYDNTGITDSVVMEWGLVCNREGWAALVESSPMVGYMIGGLVLGYVADRFGRKPAFILSDLILLLTGIITVFSPNLGFFIGCRIITGIGLAGMDSVAYIIGLELVGSSKRTLAGVLCWFFETGGLLLTVIVAYFITDNWRLLQLVYSIPFLVLLSYLWVTPESIRWLLSKGQKAKAIQLLKALAKQNKVTIDQELLLNLHEPNASSDTSYTPLDLFKYPQLRAKTMLLSMAWVVCSALYYVLLLDQKDLSSNQFIGFFVTSAVQIPGVIFMLMTLERPFFGRQRSLTVMLILGGLCLLLVPFLPKEVAVATSIVGRFCANSSFMVLYLFSTEQFPTVIRGVGMGVCFLVSRFGSFLAPYVMLLGSPWSSVAFGVSSVVAGVGTVLLPETLGRDLPETIEDGEQHQVSFFGH